MDDSPITADALLENPDGDDGTILAALGPLASVTADDLACRTPSGDEVRRGAGRTREDAERAVRGAHTAVLEFDGYALLAADARRAAEAPDVHRTKARLHAIAMGDEPPLSSGTNVPYVRLDVRPTLVGAARVFSLSRGQSEPFFLLADVLQREVAGERCAQVGDTSRALHRMPCCDRSVSL